VVGGRLLNQTYMPLDEISHSPYSQTGREALLNTNITFNAIPHYSTDIAYSYVNEINKIKSSDGIETFTTRNLVNLYATWDETSIKWNIPIGDQLQYNNDRGSTHIGRAQLNYSRQWNQHRLDGIAGTEIRNITSSYYAHNVWGFN